MNTRSRSTGTLAILLAILLVTIAIYYPGLSGDYMFDDTSNLLDNKMLEFDTLTLDNLNRATFSSHSGVLRRPVSMASFALNRYFFGIGPWSHKVINLGIHLINGILLFLLGRMLVDSYRALHRPGLSDRAVFWMPLVLAGLWLVHPLNLTSVLYIVQRMTSLSALFTLAGLCLYVHGRRRMLAGAHGMAWLLAGLLGCGSLAVLSKESGILLPLYLLVVEITLFRFHSARRTPDRGLLAFFALFLLLPGLLALYYLVAHADVYLAYGGRDFTLGERLLTEPRVLLFYLKLILVPSVQELGLYHDDIAHSHGLLDPPATLYALLALGALLTTGLLLIRKAPLVSLGILWFLTGHVLESSVFPLELVHEHRNYLADYGILLAISAALMQAPLQRLARPVCRYAPVLAMCLFAYTTWNRSMQWSDNIDHAVFEALHHPGSARAVFAAGRIHARLALNGRTESLEPALHFLAQAGTLDPGGIMPDVTLVKLNYLLDRPVDPSLFDSIIQKLENHPLTPADISSLKELAECYNASCKIPAPTMEAIFTPALASNDTRLLTIYGFYTINKRGNLDKGLELFTRVVELNPNEPQHWKNLINLLIVMAHPDEAEQRLATFRSLQPVGSTASDFRVLQEEIDRLRTRAFQPDSQHRGNS